MARLGTPHCYQCGAPIQQQSIEEIQEELMQLPAGTKAMILAPMVRGRKGQHREVFAAIRKAGFLRARVDGDVVDVDAAPELNSRKNHDIEAVIDRIVIREGIEDRLAESLRLAVTHGEGALLVSRFERLRNRRTTAVWIESIHSTLYACPNCKISYEELEPRTFSFNSPYGACPSCEGLGWRVQFDPDLILPDRELSLAERRDRSLEDGHDGRRAPPSPAARTVCNRRLAALENADRRVEARGVRAISAWGRRQISRPADSVGKGICHRHAHGHSAAAGRFPRQRCVRGMWRFAPAAGSPQRAVRRPGDSRNRGPVGVAGGGIF